jgi:hypothetical protein
MSDLVECNMSHLREVQDAIPYALQGEWTYQVEQILEHRPVGPRKVNRKLRPKSSYEFLTKYKHIPVSQEEGDKNLSRQPWTAHTIQRVLRLFSNIKLTYICLYYT